MLVLKKNRMVNLSKNSVCCSVWYYERYKNKKTGGLQATFFRKKLRSFRNFINFFVNAQNWSSWTDHVSP